MLLLNSFMPSGFCYLLDALSALYAGGRRFDPRRSDQISFVEIWSWNNFFGHSLPAADVPVKKKAVVNYWWRYGHLVLVNHLENLPMNSVD